MFEFIHNERRLTEERLQHLLKRHREGMQLSEMYTAIDLLISEIDALRSQPQPAEAVTADPRKWRNIAPRYSVGRAEDDTVLILDHDKHHVIAHSTEHELKNVVEMLNRANGWLPTETAGLPAPTQAALSEAVQGVTDNRAIARAREWLESVDDYCDCDIGNPNYHSLSCPKVSVLIVKDLIDSVSAPPALPDSVRAVDGAGLIAQERQRQISKEGYSPEHDDGHTSGELARAAACYAIEDFVIDDDSYFLEWWPWEEQWWKPQDRTTNLIRAGALIAAEIDRLQRAALTALDAGAGKE